jgi:hypothetical protein
MWSKTVYPAVMTIEDNTGTVICSRMQVPFLLAYALTVHRAQGMTLDAVTFHVDGLFAKGQLYTALAVSRLWKHNFSCSNFRVPKSLTQPAPCKTDLQQTDSPLGK